MEAEASAAQVPGDEEHKGMKGMEGVRTSITSLSSSYKKLISSFIFLCTHAYIDASKPPHIPWIWVTKAAHIELGIPLELEPPRFPKSLNVLASILCKR